MDLEEFVISKICDNNLKALNNLVVGFSKNKKSNKDLKEAILNVYSRAFLTSNLWLLHQVYKFFEGEESAFRIMGLLAQNKDIINIPILTDDVKKNITKLIYNYKKEHHELEGFKALLTGNVYVLFNILYHYIIRCGNPSHACAIALYILSLKKSQVFWDGKEEDIGSLFFVLLEQIRVDDHYKDYIALSKKLYQYHKKNSAHKANLIVACLYVIVAGEKRNTIIDFNLDIQKPDKKKYVFLYTIHNWDYRSNIDLEKEKMMRKLKRYEDKSLEVENNILLERNTVEVVKK
jgi:hypothetical protein